MELSTKPLAILLLVTCLANSNPTQEKFFQCLSKKTTPPNSFPTSSFITPTNTSFTSILNSTAQNLRYLLPSVEKPQVIYTPLNESHVQAAVICAKQVGLQLRVRSGGHDYEGLSYSSEMGNPFVVLDMSSLHSVMVNVGEATAWVEAGATIGELYYRVAEQSPTLGFPAGICPSIGIGGHITGGAYGAMMRKYGIGADNVVDVRVVDANGKVLDRAAMGEDVFWALRGGGGGSFGVILAWKVKLVPVPQRVTTFTIVKTLEQGLTKLFYRWQQVADTLDENLFIRTLVFPNSTEKTIHTRFNGVFLDSCSELMQVMEQSFPELGLVQKDCNEMSWIESTIYEAEFPTGSKTEVLLQRKPVFRNYFKAKSDFVRELVPETGLDGLWKKLIETGIYQMIWNPYGGRMGQISESETAFPHRKGVKYMIQYVAIWHDGGELSANEQLSGVPGISTTISRGW